MYNLCRNALRAVVKSMLVEGESVVIHRRWAGHSKWANIKHTKALNDGEKTKTFTRLARMIRVTILETKNPNPETNRQLQNVLEQCRRANMPNTTIANAIKTAVANKGAEEKSSILHIRGPGRCALLVEIASTNVAHFKNQASAVMKKHGCSYEKAVTHDYKEKGVLFAGPLKDSKDILGDATDHAIAAGAEDVTYDEETGKLRFECSPEYTFKAKKELENQGYTVDSAVVEFLAVNKVSLTDEQLDVLHKFITKLDVFPEVLKITDNIE